MTHYSATSLEQIADKLDRRADNEIDAAVAFGLREAATLVRNTRLADPAMEAMVKALEVMLAVHDMQQAPAGDRIAAWASAVTAARAALKLAKDNGHV